MKIVWTNEWYSPPKETAAAKALVAAGADVLGMNVDSPASGVYAESKGGIPWVGYDSGREEVRAEAVADCLGLRLGPVLPPSGSRRRLPARGSPASTTVSINDGFTKLAPYGPSVTAKTKAAIAAKLAALKSGKFAVFQGPLYDQSGKLIVPGPASA